MASEVDSQVLREWVCRLRNQVVCRVDRTDRTQGTVARALLALCLWFETGAKLFPSVSPMTDSGLHDRVRAQRASTGFLTKARAVSDSRTLLISAAQR